jgi:hypothetical protein
MKKILLTLLLVNSIAANATNYYFSSVSGDDSRSLSEAQNSQTPWKSLAKLNEIMPVLAAGDIVSFKSGEVFDGAILLTKSGASNSPITFTSYGAGAKPVISGFLKVSNWTTSGGGIFESVSPSYNTSLNTILINGIPQRIGRYPNITAANKGYLTITNTNGGNQIYDDQMAGYNWTNGDIVIRKARWVVDRNFITSQSGNTITYNSQSPNATLTRYGYFIQNHPAALDQQGEWCFNSANKKLNIYLAAGTPANFDIQASVVNTLVTINNQNNLVFENISFKGANVNAFEINSSSQIRINNCDILYSGVDAFKGSNSNNLRIENSFIYYTNNNGFEFPNTNNVTISRNTIKCTGVFAGMGSGDSGSYEAILIDGNNHTIEFNEIDSTGYNPLTYRGSFNIIRNNFISNFNFTKDDGGGIYSWNNIAGAPASTGTKITDNIVIKGLGASEGAPDAGYEAANGIYLDDNTSNVEVARNTVAFCGLNGIYLHNAHEISIHNNTLYANRSQIVMSEDNFAPASPIRNITLNDNQLVSKENFQPVAEYLTENNDLSSFGSFDRNSYSRPTFDHFVINASYKINGTYFNKALDLPEWKNLYSKDQASTRSPVVLPSGNDIRFEYNSTSSSKTIALDATYVNVYSAEFSGSITLQPYTSVVLLKKATEVPPSLCAGAGTVLLEVWENVSGSSVADIPLGQSPNRSIQLPFLEFNNIGDNYGSRIRGFLCSPQSGNYTFYIAGDDAAELWLSTNENPANKTKIAGLLTYTALREWNKFSSQKSATISLNAGTKYYFEVLQKEVLGGDNVSVGWQLPDGTFEGPIQGSHLVSYVNSGSKLNQTISFTPIPTKGVNDPPFALSASSSAGLPVAFRLVSGPATISNAQVSITGLGKVVIEASQGGNTEYNPAPTVTQSFDVVTNPPTGVCTATGSILREIWSNVPGNNIWDIPLSNVPTSSSTLSSFEGPTDVADNYASRIRGYICPPTDGNYIFLIAGDDACELWLSSDDNPGNKTRIAYLLSWTNPREWYKFPTQQSSPVFLQAGKKYYIEALHKEGAGGDNVAVAWQLPGGIMEAPIPGSRLSPYQPVSSPLTQTINFNTIPNVSFGVAPFVISATASSGLQVSFRVVSGPASISGNTVTVNAGGTVTIEASQAGNANYSPAPVVTRSFVVTANTDNTPPTIVTKNITVNTDINGQATIQPTDVIQSITDNTAVDNSSIAISQSVFNCPPPTSPGGASQQAYSSASNRGVQNWGGELGMSFRVNNAAGISINQLGAFDHLGNGITGSQGGGIRVAIFNKSTRTIVPGLDVTIVGNGDTYVGNYRNRNISSVTLMPGEYMIVAKGYNQNELNGNSSLGSTITFGDITAGAISYVSDNYFGSEVAGFSYPSYSDGGTRYLAGNFSYSIINNSGTTGSVSHQAYATTTVTGVQNYGGELGMTFRVNNSQGITLSQLGAFDHMGNGITGTQNGGIRVAIFNKATQSIIPGMDAIITGNADGYAGNYRMKNISPRTLLPGDYLVVAKGYNQNELNGNTNLGSSFPNGDVGNGAISYISDNLFGPEIGGFAYPAYRDGGTGYLGGTFTYSINGSSSTSTVSFPVIVTANDIYNNTAQATATVTLLCNQSTLSRQTNRMAATTQTGLQEVVLGNDGTVLKIFPNPTKGQFTLQITDLKVPPTSIEIIGETGERLMNRNLSLPVGSKVVKLEFDLNAISAGLYFVRVISQQGIQVAKLLVIK